MSCAGCVSEAAEGDPLKSSIRVSVYPNSCASRELADAMRCIRNATQGYCELRYPQVKYDHLSFNFLRILHHKELRFSLRATKDRITGTMGDAEPTAYLHMTTVPTGLRIAQVVGLTSTAFLAGEMPV